MDSGQGARDSAQRAEDNGRCATGNGQLTPGNGHFSALFQDVWRRLKVRACFLDRASIETVAGERGAHRYAILPTLFVDKAYMSTIVIRFCSLE